MSHVALAFPDAPLTRPRARPGRAARVACVAAALLIAGCATAPPLAAPAPPPLTTATPEQMVDAIRATAGDGADELAVQPLRNTEVEDLRREAQQLEAARRYADAASALDAALSIVADDPALLQERAEIALLLGDARMAEAIAGQAHALGSQVGPLCRRHWATVEQARLLAADADGAAAARGRVEACRVAAPNRF